MSETTKCRAWREPGGVSTIPIPKAIEQAEPGGRQLHDAKLVADGVVVVLIEASFLSVEGLRMIYV
jgi:hypothetical protein